METAPKPNTKRGFKFWRKKKGSKKKDASPPPPPTENLSNVNSSLSICHDAIPSLLTQEHLNEPMSLRTPERNKISSYQNNINEDALSSPRSPIHTIYDHDAATPPFKNALSPQNLDSAIVPPPSLYQDENNTPKVITEEKKRLCRARLHTIAKTHGVYAGSNDTPIIRNSPNMDQNQQYREAAFNSSQPIPTMDEGMKRNASPKSVMGDLSNQIVTIWNESNFSNVLSCANQTNLIHDAEVRQDLCFCPELSHEQDSFDGDIRIYERYMDMKRRSRLVEEEDSDSDSDGQGTYSGRILTVTSRKDKSVKKDTGQGDNAGNEDIDNGFNTYSSTGRSNCPETIDERLDALVGNVLGDGDDDSLDRMMRQLNFDNKKIRETTTNQPCKKDTDMSMPSRTQSTSLPWDEKSHGVYEDILDDEKGCQTHSSRLSMVEDSPVYGIQNSVKAEVNQYNPLNIVRTGSEESI